MTVQRRFRECGIHKRVLEICTESLLLHGYYLERDVGPSEAFTKSKKGRIGYLPEFIEAVNWKRIRNMIEEDMGISGSPDESQKGLIAISSAFESQEVRDKWLPRTNSDFPDTPSIVITAMRYCKEYGGSVEEYLFEKAATILSGGASKKTVGYVSPSAAWASPMVAAVRSRQEKTAVGTRNSADEWSDYYEDISAPKLKAIFKDVLENMENNENILKDDT